MRDIGAGEFSPRGSTRSVASSGSGDVLEISSGKRHDLEDMERRLRDAYGKLAGMRDLQRRVHELERGAEHMRSELGSRYEELAALETMLERVSKAAPVRAAGKRMPVAPADIGRVLRVLGRWKQRRLHGRDMRRIEVSGLFDARWYLSMYPDVAASGTDPLRHYLEFGASEGREVGPAFDVADYLRRHPEAVGSNPLLHYLARARRTPTGVRIHE